MNIQDGYFLLYYRLVIYQKEETMPTLCLQCNMHHVDASCPHCAQAAPKRTSIPLALLLGLGLSACPSKDKDTSTSDTATEPASEASPEPADAALYGVPAE